MNSKPSYKTTEIGEIPGDWEVTAIKEVISEIKNGFASGKRDEDGIVQIRMNNVTTDGKIILDRFLKVPVPDNIERYLLQRNDVLFNNTNSIDLVGKSALFEDAPFPCTFSNHFTRLRVNKARIIPQWILYHLLSMWSRQYFQKLAIRHVGQSAVHSDEVLRLKIPLPPLPEQRKISTVLSTVDDAIQKTDEIISKTQQLKKGLMQQLLTKGIGHTRFKQTEIGEIPEDWEVVRLYDVATEFISGGTPSTSHPEYWNGDIPWMRSASIARRFVDSGEKNISEEGLRNSATNIVPKGNVLVATRVSIGNVAVNNIDVAISQDLTGVVIEKTRAYPEYVYWTLVHSETKIRSLVQGSTIKGILREDLKNITSPLPPLPEQQKITSILSGIDDKIEKEKQRRGQQEHLKRGLMQVLLTGKVKVNVNQLAERS